METRSSRRLTVFDYDSEGYQNDEAPLELDHDLAGELEQANVCIAEMNNDLTAVREENERLRNALAIYADIDNWGKWQTNGGDFCLLIPGDNDYEYGGQLAHEALMPEDE